MTFIETDQLIVYEGERSGESGLTWSQKEILLGFLTSAIPRGGEFNPSRHISVPGDVRMEEVLKAIADLVAQNECLRAKYFMRDGEWMQRIHRRGTLRIRVHTLDEENLADHMDGIISEYSQMSFLMAADQPIRITIVRSGPSSRSIDIVVSVFHLSTDMMGIGILEEELLGLIGGHCSDGPVLQVLDQARRQGVGHERAAARAERHWAGTLARAPQTCFIPSSSEPSWHVTSLKSKTLSTAVLRAARRTRTSPPSLLAAAIAFAMCIYSGNDRYAYLIWSYNRFSQAAMRSVSQQAQTVVTDVEFTAASFYETAASAHNALLRAYLSSECDPSLSSSIKEKVEEDRGARIELGVVNIVSTLRGNTAADFPAGDAVVLAPQGTLTTTRSPRPGKRISHHFQAFLYDGEADLEFHVDQGRVPDFDAQLLVGTVEVVCHMAALDDLHVDDIPNAADLASCRHRSH